MLTVPGSVLTAPCESMGWVPDYRHVTDEENKAPAHCQGAGDPDASRGCALNAVPCCISAWSKGTRPRNSQRGCQPRVEVPLRPRTARSPSPVLCAVSQVLVTTPVIVCLSLLGRLPSEGLSSSSMVLVQGLSLRVCWINGWDRLCLHVCLGRGRWGTWAKAVGIEVEIHRPWC